MDEVLEELGLTNLEIKIYKLLLNQGPNQAGKISRLTGIHRRNAYDALERLIQKGMVSFIKENNNRVYEANDPSIVLEKLKTKQNEWEELMPEIIGKMNSWEEHKETLFFRGVNGIKHVFLDQIKEGKEILVHATSTDVNQVVKYFLPKYQLLRKEKHIPTRMLVDRKARQEHDKTLKKLEFCKYKYIDNYNTTKSSQYIYGNNLAIVVWSEDPFAILIRHSEITQSMKERFEIMWELN